MSEEMIQGYTKEEFLSLILNQLKTKEDKEEFYQKMLLGLHQNDPVYQSEEVGPEGEIPPSDVLKNIFQNIDWKMLTGTEYGEDEFFNGKDGLYTSLGEELKKIFEAEGNDYKRKDLAGDGDNTWWTNSYWNESVAKLLQILAQRIDPENIMTYEKSGLLIELISDEDNPDNEGKIDVAHLRAGLKAQGATAELRMIDIMDADAGNSFEGEKDTYWYGDYYDSLTLTYMVEDEPITTILTKVLFKENADTILSKIRNEQEITGAEFKNLITVNKDEKSNACIYSGLVSSNAQEPPERLLVTMKQSGEYYRFKVVKNPWVIPWYNFDGNTYSRVRGDDKHVSALTDKNKLDFTRLDEDEMISSAGFKQQAKHVYDIIKAYKEEREKLINAPSTISFITYESAIEPIGSIDMNNRQYPKEESFPPDTLDAGYYYWPLSDFQTYEGDFYITITCSKLKQTTGLYPEQLTDEYCEQYCKEIVQQAIDSLGGDVSTLPSVAVSDAIAAQEDPDGIIISGYKSYNVYVGTYDDIPYQLKQFLYMLGECGSIEILKRKIERLADKYGIDYSDLVPVDKKREIEIIDEDSFVQLYSTKVHRWIRLLMPRYKRKVEVEDLNRNFWVIGQVLAGISADLFDEEGPIGGMIKGLLKEIAQLWENVVYLWAALALLSQKRFYGETHTEVVMLPAESFSPYLTYDDFDKGHGNAAILEKLSYLLKMYPEKNLMILPCIRINNYEHNYYGELVIPGVYIYDRNKEDEQWEIITFNYEETQNFINNGKLDFILYDYRDKIYGILEEEERYNYVAPLSHAENIHADDDTRFYGIARDKIDFEGQLYAKNSTGDWVDNRYINVNMRLHDLAAELATKEEKIIISFNGSYVTSSDKIVLRDIVNIYYDDPIEDIDPTYIPIEKGYYQGEILSTSMDAAHIIYDIFVLPTAELKPVLEDVEVIKQGYTTSAYAEMRAEDEVILNKILTNFEEYNNDAEHFWTTTREDRFASPPFYYAQPSGESPRTAVRQDAPKQLYDQTEKAYETISDWENENKNYFKTAHPIEDTTILFVEGHRKTNYTTRMDSDAGHEYYFPYDGEDTDGLTSALCENHAVLSTNTGAMISIPTKQGRVTSFYPNHLSIDGIGTAVHTSIHYTPQNRDIGAYQASDDSWIPYAQVGALHSADFKFGSSFAGGGSAQWLVSLLDGEKEVTPTNWLVTKIETPYTTRSSLWRNGSPTGFEKFGNPGGNFEDEDFHIQLARRIAQDEYDNNTSDQTIGHLAQVIRDRFIALGIEDASNPVYNMETWYYDQAIQHGIYDEWYIEQCKLYNTLGNTWDQRVREWCQIWNITPIERDSLGLNDPEGNTFTNRIFIGVSMNTDVKVYVFGPNGLYSRKCYSRDATGRYSLVKNEETSQGTVDQIREDYYVISNNVSSQNKEKYKSFHKLLANNAGYYNVQDDDDFSPTWYEQHVKWEDRGTDYPWDIPS